MGYFETPKMMYIYTTTKIPFELCVLIIICKIQTLLISHLEMTTMLFNLTN